MGTVFCGCQQFFFPSVHGVWARGGEILAVSITASLCRAASGWICLTAAGRTPQQQFSLRPLAERLRSTRKRSSAHRSLFFFFFKLLYILETEEMSRESRPLCQLKIALDPFPTIIKMNAPRPVSGPADLVFSGQTLGEWNGRRGARPRAKRSHVCK